MKKSDNLLSIKLDRFMVASCMMGSEWWGWLVVNSENRDGCVLYSYGCCSYSCNTYCKILSDSIVCPESFVAFRMWSENALVSPSPSCWMVRIELVVPSFFSAVLWGGGVSKKGSSMLGPLKSPLLITTPRGRTTIYMTWAISYEQE